MTIRTLDRLHKLLIDESAKQEILLATARDRSLASDADPGLLPRTKRAPQF